MSSLFARKHSDPPAAIPTYLLPSLPFRRSSLTFSLTRSRHSSADSTATPNPTTTTTLPPPPPTGTDTPSSNPFSRSPTPLPPDPTDTPIDPPTDKYLHGASSHISCSKCATHLALTSQLISKGFTGRHGRAYLVSGHPSSKYASTQRTIGSHGALPNTYLSKPIARSLVTGQHVVSDLNCLICGSLLGWKYVEASEESQKYKVGKFILETKRVRVATRWEGEVGCGFGEEETGEGDGELEFDSQDEDECEDLFAGVWSPGLAGRRRQRKSERFRRKAAKVYVPRGSQESLGG